MTRKVKLPTRTIDEIKDVCRVLFIDDKKFDTTEILQRGGWNVTWVKDIDAIDCNEVKDAHIVFIDIQGVGRRMKFSDEGLGIVSALKDHYPEKKVIVYSSISEGDRFNKSLKMADNLLSKNADPYQFQVILEDLSKEVFDSEECLLRLKKYMRDELGIMLELNEIKKNVLKLPAEKEISRESVAKVFGIALDKAGAIASIISLLIQGK